MKNEDLEYRELPAGSIIKIEGIPLELENPTSVGTHKGNWPVVEESMQERMADATETESS